MSENVIPMGQAHVVRIHACTEEFDANEGTLHSKEIHASRMVVRPSDVIGNVEKRGRGHGPSKRALPYLGL